MRGNEFNNKTAETVKTLHDALCGEIKCAYYFLQNQLPPTYFEHLIESGRELLIETQKRLKHEQKICLPINRVAFRLRVQAKSIHLQHGKNQNLLADAIYAAAFTFTFKGEEFQNGEEDTGGDADGDGGKKNTDADGSEETKVN